MGTEVQSKMYLPGCYSMKDLSNSASYGGWSLHHESKPLKNGQHYDIFLTRPIVDGFDFDGYNKEQLRQTIMKHESIFRHQVRELHRLYKIQRDLMNEIKSKERARQSIPTGMSKSSLFSSGFPSVDDKRSWDFSKLPSASSNYGSSTDFIQSHCNSMVKGKITQSSFGPMQNGVRLKDYEPLDSKSSKFERRLFDLERPAHEYINDDDLQGDSEMSRAAGCQFNKSNVATHATDDNLSNHTCDNSGYSGHPLKSSLYSRRALNFTDLNEPIEVEEVCASASVTSLRNETCLKGEIQRQSTSTNAHIGTWSSETRKDEGLSILHVMNKGSQKEWSSYTSETEQIRSKRSYFDGSFHLEDYQEPLESSRSKAKASDLVMSFPAVQNTTEKQMKRTIFGVEISETNNDSSTMAPKRHVLQNTLVPQSEAANSDSSTISSWTRPPVSMNQTSISVQGQADFSTSSSISLMQIPQVIGDRSLVTTNSGSIPNLKAEVSYQDSDRVATQSRTNQLQACHSSISFGFPNGITDHNSSSEQIGTGPRGYFWGLGCMTDPKSMKTCKENVVSVNEQRNQKSPYGALSWLRAVTPCDGKSCKDEAEGTQQIKINSLQNYSQHFISQTDTRRAPSQSSIIGSASTALGHDTESRRVEKNDCSSMTMILGFPIFDSPTKPGCVDSVIANGNHVKIASVKSDLACDQVSSRSTEQLKVEGLDVAKELVNDRSNLRNQIDLNISTAEEEGQPTPTSPIAKNKTQIDLEAAVETEIATSPGRDSLEKKCNEPLDLTVLEFGQPSEGLMVVAAEALVAISSSRRHDLQDNASHDLQENGSCHQSEASPSDSLLWFADIVSSYKGESENETRMGKESARDEESIPDGIDYFEYMTLNLTETKVEDICYEHQNLDNPEEEEDPLPRRPRKGQSRRGRQRKDFQRDILPSIASLSRNEVTEDLQIIEGIIRATGGTWQSSLTTRNAGKSGRGRGRRRARCSAPSSPVAVVCEPQVQQSNCREAEGEERSLVRWGKRTRRPPRLRYSLNNPPVLLK
ncbi:uncharacterized protein LOC107415920 isoform X1 [Ziziphus jujuba]|uniref:Uncharacterized protein LOC107415920 isoform X1 n=2 Tax=Ziziphus jujuba TaxID=326968 RepID=A0A6P6G211_ZIZJJ|nr:uncharacterized protein LOC107415920 isoform X1 [Ziziphus jujuba]XP_024928103.3 uncharacterized protein LOC107415920 isoform X1 [Ziziphus jujuba]